MDSRSAQLRRIALAALLVFSTLFWIGLAWRFISVPPLIAASFFFFKAKHSIRPAISWLVAFVALTFSPVDVIPIHKRWPPKLVPLIMGLPRPETVERAKRGEVILGGCIVTGFEPKSYLVW
jgi:hypothetical protein